VGQRVKDVRLNEAKTNLAVNIPDQLSRHQISLSALSKTNTVNYL
jgi:hypothetical protein